VVEIQPVLLVKVIVDVPAPTPLTNPVELTVAWDAVAETHGLDTAGVPIFANCVVDPTQTFNVPVIAGGVVIVTVAVIKHPEEFVYVIVAVPLLTPVTKPVLDTVATAVFEDAQGVVASGVPDPVKREVLEVQINRFPVIVGKGSGVTVLNKLVTQPTNDVILH
jgi:hypothetical protein